MNPYGPGKTAIKVYHILAEKSTEGYCDADQKELATAAELSVSTLRRSLRELEHHGWIETIRRYFRPWKRTKNSYWLKRGLPAELSTVTGQNLTDHCLVNGQKMTGLSRVDSSTGGHTGGQNLTAMHDDDDDEGIFKEMWITLDFLHEDQRSKRIAQAHCSLDFAKAWRDWWNRKDFGGLTNPAGWANLEISRGHWPPLQMHLPETTADLSRTNGQKEKSWYTNDEFNDLIQH